MLQNAVAIITGASSGIGAATALHLARSGVRLSLLARSNSRLVDIASQAETNGAIATLLCACDVREEQQVEQAIDATLQQFGRIDILINSAGLSLDGNVDGYATEDWRTVLDTNLTGTFLTCRAVVPTMKAQCSGQIINISSGAGRNGIKGMAAYCASKFGVIGFTESLALELRPYNVRASVLLPGSVATNFSQTAKRIDVNDAPDTANSGYALLPTEVAGVIQAMLEQPPQAWMSEVVLRPLDLELRRSTN